MPPAFAAPLCSTFSSVRATGFTPRAVVPRSRASRHEATIVAVAGEPDEDESEKAARITAALASGQATRDALVAVSEERRALRERTDRRIMEMAGQVARLTAEVREAAGLPPVAESETKKAKTLSGVQPGARDVVNKARESGDEVDPYSDPENFGYAGAAGWQVLANESELPQVDEKGVKFRIECDQDGCSFIELQGEGRAPGPGVRSQFMHSGPGFRVGYDPDGASSFCGAIGNGDWLLAMSVDEIRHFQRLALALQKKMDRISRGTDPRPAERDDARRRSTDGMFNERVRQTGNECSVELESSLLWMQALGQTEAGKYGIRCILMEGRQSEAYWPPKVVQGLLNAVGKLAID